MTSHVLDNVALALAVVAVLLRLIDRPAVSNLLSSACIAASVAAGRLDRRERRRRDDDIIKALLQPRPLPDPEH